MAKKTTSTSTEETFSVNAAAKLTGFTVPTIRKRLPELKRAGAVMVDGAWHIPLSALHAVGLMVKVEGQQGGNITGQVEGQTFYPETRQEIDRLRGALAQAETRAAVAEALAEERRLSLERADRALLALEATVTASESRTDRPRGLFRRR